MELTLERDDRLKVLQLLKELRSLGYDYNNPNQLNSLTPKDKVVIPLLIKYLQKMKLENFKLMIVHALQVKGFVDATEILLKEFFIAEKDKSYKWSIGDTFSIIQDKRYEDQYIAIVKDKDHGNSRQMVAVTLGKIKSEKGMPVLLSVLDDEGINGHVIIALGYYDKPEIIKYLKPFLNHQKTWIKREAKRSINKIEKNVKKHI